MNDEFHKLINHGAEQKPLEQLVKEGAAFASEYYKKHEEFPYVWYVQTRAGQFPVVAPEMPRGSKDDVAFAVKTMLEEVQAESYVFMAEAWTVEVDPKDVDGETYIVPSEHPNRIEILSVYAEDSERTISGCFKIIRKKGQRPTLSKFEVSKGQTMAGRFTGLLPGEANKTRH